MPSNKAKKSVRIILGLTLLLAILSVSTPSSYATGWSSIPDIQLTWEDSQDWAPSIAQAQDEIIWVVWHNFEGGAKPDILYKVYNGSSIFPWSSAKKLTTDSGDDICPSITTTSNGNIWVVWSSNRNGNYDIVYKVYNGVSWSPANDLTTDPNIDEFPSIMQTANGTIWLTWSTNRTGNFDILYKTSTDNGTNWSSDTPLPDPVAEDDWDPSIVETADGEIWLVWVRDGDIYYKSYDGIEWSSDNLLTDDPDSSERYPSIMRALDGEIWLVWNSDRINDKDDIYCKVYNGTDWSSDTRLTFFSSTYDRSPSIMQATDGTIWIAWTSNRGENFDIYYKTDSLPQHDHDMAIFSVTHEPNVTVAYQGLNINIEVVPQNQGMEHELFAVGCYANSTPIGTQTTQIPAGQLTPLDFTWNTIDMIPGTYTIIANVTITGQTDTDPADNTFIGGQVLVKIPGDVNGEGVVDASDLLDLSKAYGAELGDPSWNPDCDFDRNKKVDASDLIDLNENYGKTI